MAKLLTSDNITQLEQSIYDNYNEVYRILCSDSTANQHVKQEYSNNEFEKLDPQVIGCQHIDIPEIQSEAFEEFDAEIIENIDVVINDCDKDLLEQTITLIGWEKLYKLIQLVLIKVDTYPKNYTKDDFEDLLKIILQIYQITHNIDDKIQSIEKTTLESQIKIGYLESFLYDDKGFTPPLKLEIKQDLSLKEVGIPATDQIEIKVLFKGEDITDKCIIKVDDNIVIPIKYDPITIPIQIESNYEQIVTKSIKVEYQDMNVMGLVSYSFKFPVYYGPKSFNELNIQELNTKLIESNSFTTFIDIQDRETSFLYAYPQSRGKLSKILDQNGLNCINSFDSIIIDIDKINYLLYYRTEKDPLDQNFTFII